MLWAVVINLNLGEGKVKHLWFKHGHKTDDTDYIGGYRTKLFFVNDTTEIAGQDHGEPKTSIYITELSRNWPADQWPL